METDFPTSEEKPQGRQGSLQVPLLPAAGQECARVQPSSWQGGAESSFLSLSSRASTFAYEKVQSWKPTGPREQKGPFAVGVRVSLHATVMDLHGETITVEFETAEGNQRIDFKPDQLKPEVGEWMIWVLQIFCGYLDIWFLRETFSAGSTASQGHPGDKKDAVSSSVENEGSEVPPKSGDESSCWESFLESLQPEVPIQDRVEKEAKAVFNQLNMLPWSMDDVWKTVRYTFGLYLCYILGPSVFLATKHVETVRVVLGVALGLMTLHSLWGFLNLRTDYTDAEALANGAHAFQAVEHAPVTPLVLLFCTHLILMVFAHRQVQELFNESRHLPFPLTYPIIVGKAFMVLRMVMAYSSANLGLSIDYFVWQELLLILCHGGLSTLVGDPSSEKEGHSYSEQLARAFKVIFCIDSVKTLVMLMFWFTFKPGTIAYHVNRLPSLAVQLTTSVLIHAVLDLVQTFVSVFTMFIGRAFANLTAGQQPARRAQSMVTHKGFSPTVDKLLGGRWRSSNGHKVTFTIHSWNISIPCGVETRKSFRFETVRENGVWILMEVRIPDEKVAGDKIEVNELRMRHAFTGCKSYDLSTVVCNDLDDKVNLDVQATLKQIGADTVLEFQGQEGVYRWTKDQSTKRRMSLIMPYKPKLWSRGSQNPSLESKSECVAVDGDPAVKADKAAQSRSNV